MRLSVRLNGNNSAANMASLPENAPLFPGFKKKIMADICSNEIRTTAQLCQKYRRLFYHKAYVMSLVHDYGLQDTINERDWPPAHKQNPLEGAAPAAAPPADPLETQVPATQADYTPPQDDIAADEEAALAEAEQGEIKSDMTILKQGEICPVCGVYSAVIRHVVGGRPYVYHHVCLNDACGLCGK